MSGVESGDPVMTTIGVHMRAMTKIHAEALTCDRVMLRIGDATEVTLFLDESAVGRLSTALVDASALLKAPAHPAAA